MIDHGHRRSFLKHAASALIVGSIPSASLLAQTFKHPEQVRRFLERLYDESHRKHTFRAHYPGGFERWQREAREELQRLVGLEKIKAQVGDHILQVRLAETKDVGGYTRRKGTIETEPNVRIPFWLLKPKGSGPFPLAVLPHGHDGRGHDTYAGVYHDDAHKEKTLAQDRNVAVQAVERGFLAIAPATRGLAVNGVPDVFARHDSRNCRSQLMHCLLAGRTAIGERVWDLQRIIDWAVSLPEVNSQHLLMMGNSGGGMATLYTAACEKRITVAVPSCSFSTIASPEGRIYHCDCNMVPGIFEWGDLYDVAGLTAPRHLLAVSGREDKLHEAASIEHAADRVRTIYKAAGHPSAFQHRWGAEGHRFYSDLMWPFVMKTVNQK